MKRDRAIETVDRTGEDRGEARRRARTHGEPSGAASVEDAIVIKDGDVFSLSRPDGAIPLDRPHGYGLYYRDCRYLYGYELRVCGRALHKLAAASGDDFRAVFEATNCESLASGAVEVPSQSLIVRVERVVDGEALTLHERWTVRNFGTARIELPITCVFGAAFEDIFEVRALVEPSRTERIASEWRDRTLGIVYDGRDGVYRSLSIRVDGPVTETEKLRCELVLDVPARGSRTAAVTFVIRESETRAKVDPFKPPAKRIEQIKSTLSRSRSEWLARYASITTGNRSLDRTIERALLDLRALRTTHRGYHYFAAGIPWFCTLFGRDSLLASLMTLAFEPSVAEDTLRLLASYQGRKLDEWKDEQPGKILHEIRFGELARMGKVPHTPYYGTVDATPLFLIAVGQHARWTGSTRLFDELRPGIEAALEWLDRYGDGHGERFVEYSGAADGGLVNQGWKDSGDAIVRADGSLAEAPIAPAEVQGYAYLARLEMAELFERSGDSARADALRNAAASLRRRFNEAFWREEIGFFALALEKHGRPCDVVSSNPGQALWTGIVDDEHAAGVAERLLAPDMFSGWGIRTLSRDANAYNAIGYHVGTVWPHDNALIARGLRRYGCDDAAQRICDAIFAASFCFPLNRLPELFAGTARDEFELPVRYPVACHPQAWSAAAVPFMLVTLLGLEPRGFDKELRIRRPLLPMSVDTLEIRGVRVADASVDLRFERTPRGDVAASVERVDGALDIVVEIGRPESCESVRTPA
ncbi:MAG TPA: glycogen debranching N-terminal domain-containing protein [Gammaproteobacteria bacterium]